VKERDLLVSKLTKYFATCPYPVTLAYLFGSQARRGATPLSDLDIAVYLANGASREELYLPLLAELRRLLKREDVDLIYLNDASPLLGHRIIRDGCLLYAAHSC